MVSSAVIDRINYINIAFILLSCGLAYLFPFHLLLFSYAVLGPAHYLTQISWLHDRHYFTARKNTGKYLAILSFVLLCVKGWLSGFVVIAALLVGLSATLSITDQQRNNLFHLGIPLAFLLSYKCPPVALFIGILTPTVIHVFVFTAGFMLSGSLKGRQFSGYAAFFVMIACAVSFFFAPDSWYLVTLPPDNPGIAIFSKVSVYLTHLFGMTPSLHTLTEGFAFLSFVYTYHYLNWFSKTRIIEWHRIPHRRMAVIAAIYGLALLIYFQDYAAGFRILLFLSLLHVLLEFPLNCRVFTGFGVSLKNAVRVKQPT